MSINEVVWRRNPVKRTFRDNNGRFHHRLLYLNDFRSRIRYIRELGGVTDSDGPVPVHDWYKALVAWRSVRATVMYRCRVRSEL